MDIRLPLQPSRSGRASSKAAALAVLATAQLVIALDYSIVNVALPDIGRSLGFTGGTVQWVISAYTLTFGGFLLLGGRAADLLGRRRMFMAALSLFDLAGALLVTLGAMAIVDSLVSAPTQGWTSVRTLVGGAIGLVLLAAFVVVELRSRSPLMPLRLPRMIVAGLGQGVAFTTMYVAAGTGVARGEQGVASAMASTAQQIGGSVGLAVLVALLSARAVALGGSPAGPTVQPPAVLTGALHVTFAAQAAIALLGAAVALFVIGPGERTRRRRRQPEPECCPEEPVRQAAA